MPDSLGSGADIEFDKPDSTFVTAAVVAVGTITAGMMLFVPIVVKQTRMSGS